MSGWIFHNLDLVSKILAYTGRLPRISAVNNAFLEANLLLEQERMEYMNRTYPLWDIDIQPYTGDQEVEDEYMGRTSILEYLMNVAAIEEDWDALIHMAFKHQKIDHLVGFAMEVAHVNHRRDLAMHIYRRYWKNLYNSYYEWSYVIEYYEMIDNPHIIPDDQLRFYMFIDFGYVPEMLRQQILQSSQWKQSSMKHPGINIILGKQADDLPTNQEILLKYVHDNPEATEMDLIAKLDDYDMKQYLMFSGYSWHSFNRQGLKRLKEAYIKYEIQLDINSNPIMIKYMKELWNQDLIDGKNISVAARLAMENHSKI